MNLSRTSSIHLALTSRYNEDLNRHPNTCRFTKSHYCTLFIIAHMLTRNTCYHKTEDIVMKLLQLLILATVVCGCYGQRMNVLFVMADDLRPEIGVYLEGDDSFYAGMKTPNIDRFADDSLVLKRAYAQQALCAPSRASILTGACRQLSSAI